MPNEKETVDQTATVGGQENDVNQDATNVQAQESSSQEVAATEQSVSEQMTDVETDDRGVSYKNRYHEYRRKYDQLADSIPQVIEQTLAQKLSNVNQNQEQPKKEYTVQELEAFAAENPQHRPWVEEEKARIIAKRTADDLEQRFSAKDKQREVQSKQENTWKKVTSEFPEYFTKDSLGRTVWDEANPTVRQIAVLMQDERLKSDPEGLYWAAEIATARSLRQSQSTQAKEKAQLKTKVKDLQKKTMVEGGQKPQATQKDDLRDSIDDLKRTGSKTALRSAVSAYFKKVGYLA